MRSAIRSVATLLLAAAVVTCVDSPASPNGGHAGATLAFTPQFSGLANQATALYSVNGLVFDSVRVLVTVPPTDAVTLKDTTVAFTSNDSSISVDLSLSEDPGVQLDVELQYKSGTEILYDGKGMVATVPFGTNANANANANSTILINPVGPGAKAASLSVLPLSNSFPTTANIPFTATVTDSSSNVIANAVLIWAVDDTTLATIGTTSGLLTPKGKRGTVNVTAATLDRVSATVAITLLPPAAKIVLASGGGQSAAAGLPLPQPVVFEVEAGDNGPVAGQTVTFSSPTATVNPTTAVTDPAGMASTVVTLGNSAGSYTINGAAAGFNVSATETATAGSAAALTPVSGNAQTDTVKRTLALPLVVKATDSHSNPVPGVAVAWARIGTGTLGAASSVTDVNGLASIAYTLGTAPGTETVTATATGVATPVTFTETQILGGAATIAIDSGNTQHAGTVQTLPNHLVVKAFDVAGNPVPGGAVTWAVTSGTATLALPAALTADATGRSAETLTLGKTAGPVTVTATLANGQHVAFAETIDPGPASKVGFTVNPPGSVATNAVMTPAIVVSVLDSVNNVVASSTATISLALTGPSATLAGTLARPAVAGVATFNDLAVNSAGSGYALTASASGLTGATSTTFVVSASVAATMVRVGPSSFSFTAGALGAAASNGIQVQDMLGHGVAGVPVLVEFAGGGGTAFDSSAATDASGFITIGEFAAVKGVPKDAVSATITFTDPMLTGSPITTSVTVTAGSAAQIGFFGSTFGGTVGAPLPAIQVAAEDAFGNLVTTMTGTVTFTLGAGSPTGAVLSGTTTQPWVSGIATFADLSVNVAGTTYTLNAASSVGALAATTPTFSAAVGGPTKLVFQQNPVSTSSRAVLVPSVKVQVQDALGNISTVPTLVTISITPGTGASGAALFGTRSVNAVSGVATFSDLSIDKAASNYQLTATATSLTGGISSVFAITPGLPTQIVFGQQPTTVAPGTAIAPAVTAIIEDLAGNPVTTSGTSVTVTLTGGPLDAALGGGTTVTTSAGVASFLALTVNEPSAGYQLSATSGSLGPVLSTAFSVTGAAISVVDPSHLIVGDALSFVAGAPPLTPYVLATDATNNPISSQGVHFHVTSGGLVAGDTTIATDVNGKIFFLAVPNFVTHAGTFQIAISAASGTFVAPNPQTVTITPAAASRYVLATNTTPAVSTTDAVVAQLSDQYGNAVSTPGITMNWSVSPATGDGTLSSSTTSTSASGSGTVTYTVPSVVSAPAVVSVSDAAGNTGSVTITPSGSSTTFANLQVISTLPTTASDSVPFASQPMIQLVDATGAPVHLAGVVVVAVDESGGFNLSGSFATSFPGLSVAAPAAITDSRGIATFTGLEVLTPASGTVQLVFAAFPAASGLPAVAGPFSVVVAPTQPSPRVSLLSPQRASDGDSGDSRPLLGTPSGPANSGPIRPVAFQSTEARPSPESCSACSEESNSAGCSPLAGFV